MGVMILALSTPLRQVNPPAQCVLAFSVGFPVSTVKLVVEVVKEGPSKKAQVPPQRVAISKGVVGAVATVNCLVTALASERDEELTVVFAASTPAPEYTVILVGGVATVGMLGAGLEGR